MITPIAIRQNKLLSRNVNPLYKMYVYDESSSKSDKLPTVISQLARDQVFYLTQLEGYQGCLSVSCCDVRVVTVSGYEYQVLCWYSEEFCSLGYRDEF